MNNELKDYTETPNEKRRRSQQVRQSLENSASFESDISFIGGFQSTFNMSQCSTSNATENSSFANGCSSKRKIHIDSQNSAIVGSRAALCRNIYDSSSSEDDDEHCVYTYKGAEMGSDLPDAFVHLGVSGLTREGASARSSPEMDFLEMDFDPGPSNGQDSDCDSDPLLGPQSSSDHRHDVQFVPEDASRVRSNEFDNVQHEAYDENANCYSNKSLTNVVTAVAGCSDSIVVLQESNRENPCCSKNLKLPDEIDNTEYSITPFFNSQNYLRLSDEESSNSKNVSVDLDNKFETDENEDGQKLSEDSDEDNITFIANGFDPIEPSENINEDLLDMFESLCDISLVNERLGLNDFISYDDLLPLDPSYSISAVVNVMNILKDSQRALEEREQLVNLLRSKQVAETMPLVEYLFMRSMQNANETDLANLASITSENKLHSRFFSTYPNAHFNLVEWLYSWMRKGAVPVVTRNLQERGTLATKNIIRHPWRHNVVYKLESPYVHVLNPYERVRDCVLYSQLSQPSLIYVKRKCILQKWHSKVDLRLLMRANHNRWYNENVLGQVATILRENHNDNRSTTYVRIPSNCRCGITLFVPSENFTLCREIDEALELN